MFPLRDAILCLSIDLRFEKKWSQVTVPSPLYPPTSYYPLYITPLGWLAKQVTIILDRNGTSKQNQDPDMMKLFFALCTSI